MTTTIELGVSEIAQQVHLRLRRYLEAQYHIRDTGLIQERRSLLDEPGGISQRPFIEITPSYAVSPHFGALRAPAVVTRLLDELQGWTPGVGVFQPYRHQADALEHFFSRGGDGDDLVVATGTGSGKTETFLYAILGSLAIEGAERSASFLRSGIRALLLYPMNALVSDQTARLRRFLGDPRLAALMRDRWGRHPRFGMYTSRTPYPGVRTGTKDQRHLETLLGYYEGLATSDRLEDVTLVSELQRRGRWPAKDIVSFFGRDAEERVTVKSGKTAGRERTLHHWDERFITQPDDRELLTRHEMQQQAPDLLVTNYSMLEYMLLRPIERPLFTQTRDWLASDSRNQLLLILDEAHMYRGVGGAEVGLLIRRLLSRLGIGRDRLHCILTSASLGSEPSADDAAREFVHALTGQTRAKTVAVVRGTRESRPVGRPGTQHEAAVLSTVTPVVLATAALRPTEADTLLGALAEAFGWPVPPPLTDGEALATRQHICRCLTGFGPLESLLQLASANALEFSHLSRTLFPDSDYRLAERATDGLLALGTFARRAEPGREDQPLLPTRVHLLYRGLPPLYVCVNPECTARRSPSAPTLAGKLYTEPRTQCDCGSRVFELLTHRDCGAAYLRAYGTNAEADFLWHERGGILTEFGRPLHEIHLLLEEPHRDQLGAVTPVILDVQTGRVLDTAAGHTTGTRVCYRARVAAEHVPNTTTFGVCPVCTRRTQTGGSLKIMDLATKGEQPFANLVREQFVTQYPTRPCTAQHPNEGRKALLFSDGRQKAARLARDLPREVERDSFREALVLACQQLGSLPTPRQAVLDEPLYAAFVAVSSKYHLHFFDGHSQKVLLEECTRFRRDYDEDLDLALSYDWRPTPPTRYRTALLRQIGDPYYSLIAACAAVLSATPSKLRILLRRLPGLRPPSELADIAHAWLREMVSRNAFDASLSKDARLDEFGYFQPIRAADGLKQFFEKTRVMTGLGVAEIAALREALFDVFTRDATSNDDSGRLVTNDAVMLRLAIDDVWLQCAACGHLQAEPFLGGCSNCGDTRLEPRPPEHPYMVARKDFFRESLRSVLRGNRPIHLTAEEHTAQLSQRDAGVVYATTEEFELRFQDVPLGPEKPPVDILSCTTTMEVGIDIGSLTAVALRTVPPQRENYQQRAGRAGRRGTSVSSVLMFAQGGAHDAHYFAQPQAIISGPPRQPRIKADNRRLARRHVNAHLLQTFFHAQLDALSSEEQADIAADRPGIMSAFGDITEFFMGSGEFSFGALERWLRSSVLTPHSAVVEQIAAWLPSTNGLQHNGAEPQRTVREIATLLLHTLNRIREEVVGQQDTDGTAVTGTSPGGENAGGLIDLLFERGLLPSYAFPTDLCSFVIQEWDKKEAGWRVAVAERPQLAKAQALSEYAPGRLLVVNKQTYRVGGIFVEGAPTASPVAALFSQPLDRYVGCPRCSFLSIEPGSTQRRTTEGTPCPVCRSPLFVREYLDPPAFTPEEGRALREGDRDQDITFASSAQLPEIAGRDDFNWQEGPGANLRHAYGEDVLLVVANKGRDAAGFSVCEMCGAAWLDGEEPEGAHARPFLLPNQVREKEGASARCPGEIRRGLFLVHDFRTDLLVLRGSFRSPMDFSPEQPWLYDALATLAEGLALGASLHLDIDPGELSGGFRLLPPLAQGDEGVAEIFLFDTSSGGAGYAADAGAELDEVLNATDKLLRRCPANCERSCTKCLRHYGNRFLHSRLDRYLAADLLDYLRFGTYPTICSLSDQARVLRPLARLLTLEGWHVDAEADTPLQGTRPDGVSVAVGTYPCLLRCDFAESSQAMAGSAHRRVLLPDYLVAHDLPSAYQVILGHKAVRQPRPTTGPLATSTPGRLAVELPVKEFRRSAAPETSGTVRLHIEAEIPSDAFAIRVPGHGLEGIGFSAGDWLIARPLKSDDFKPTTWVALVRARSNFGSTAANWTIAHVRSLGTDESGARFQISYGSATGRNYRPERVAETDVILAATVVCHAVGGD